MKEGQLFRLIQKSERFDAFYDKVLLEGKGLPGIEKKF